MPVWVSGNVIAIEAVGPGLTGLLDALYQHKYRQGWDRLQRMCVRRVFAWFHDRVRDERARGTLRMGFALLRTHIAARKEQQVRARERRRAVFHTMCIYCCRLLRSGFTQWRHHIRLLRYRVDDTEDWEARMEETVRVLQRLGIKYNQASK